MTLPDYPPFVINWETGVKGEMLRALGNLAVVSARAEELLHQIYWNHAGLNERNGPIITDNLNPKRLQEDIIKLISLDKTKANILADLRLLFSEMESLNTKRNHCLHWIWQVSEEEDASVTLPDKPIPHRLHRPIYRQAGILTQEFTVEEVKTFCKEIGWLQFRLRSHSFSDDELRQRRNELSKSPPLNGMALCDLFWPAPWLDKPLPPETKP
jgi:hypothetical protein